LGVEPRNAKHKKSLSSSCIKIFTFPIKFLETNLRCHNLRAIFARVLGLQRCFYLFLFLTLFFDIQLINADVCARDVAARGNLLVNSRCETIAGRKATARPHAVIPPHCFPSTTPTGDGGGDGAGGSRWKFSFFPPSSFPAPFRPSPATLLFFLNSSSFSLPTRCPGAACLETGYRNLSFSLSTVKSPGGIIVFKSVCQYLKLIYYME